ncbi:11400_t:CDS:1, partial [Scutellospora calospora]
FKQVIENYTNIVKFDDNIFDNNIESIKNKDEEFDTNYISDTKDLDDLLQYDNKNLEIKNILDFNII